MCFPERHPVPCSHYIRVWCRWFIRKVFCETRNKREKIIDCHNWLFAISCWQKGIVSILYNVLEGEKESRMSLFMYRVECWCWKAMWLICMKGKLPVGVGEARGGHVHKVDILLVLSRRWVCWQRGVIGPVVLSIASSEAKIGRTHWGSIWWGLRLASASMR